MVPTWYWIVSGILLIWNAIGCFACFSQMTASPEKLAGLPEGQRDAWLAMPVTAKAAYVVAVGAGLLGAVALLCRCAAAGPLFIASLVGVIVQFGWFFVVYKGASRFGVASLAFPGFVALVAIAQIGFACWAKTQGLLG
ncbi:hypothetical protein [Rhizorhabdus dicambivorans]|uniref:Sugar transporter n=1 Tax=Rhizorhabdus dicambivorans TaxID=1850238 RepID=A0A2A4G2G3_9SPHN|nr:hypothetical protein [Rhizorhabdus dicambivorans]ATE64942.1 hypothetical protein CMV14_11470 [Rhizorhabdus dicambivorans]PCE44216.1 hypothetical protein COO09_00855 [Rhizorhabdus dicambivorans]